jgi:hypothetical protein
VLGLFLSLSSRTPAAVVVLRAVIVGVATLFAYGLFEQWPKRLPAGSSAGRCSSPPW